MGTIIIAGLAAPLTRLALLFGPAEYFSLMVMGLVFAVVLARGSLPKAFGMILVGVLLSTVGTDLDTGEERMTFGYLPVADGIDFAVLAMGIFGFAECCVTSRPARPAAAGGARRRHPRPRRPVAGGAREVGSERGAPLGERLQVDRRREVAPSIAGAEARRLGPGPAGC